MIRTTFESIVIDPSVEETPLAVAVRRNAGATEVISAPTAGFAADTRHVGRTAGKRFLLVERFQGHAVKLCQGLKPGYACCNLHTLAEANNCSMECTYCILQFYMNSPHLSVFANTMDLQAEILRRVALASPRLLRIGTGELSDSLLLDPLTESTRQMVPFFRRLPNAVLELKTKTDNIENLLELGSAGKTVVSWSVNPSEIVEREELKTAPLRRRLAAARALAFQGYPIGFHIDPMIDYLDWQDGYAALVDALLDAVPPQQIAWISIGSLRFPPSMKATVASRFPRSELRYGELVRGADGKLHYLRPQRIEMYRWVVERLRRQIRDPSQGPVLYLCMESPEVWERVFDEPAPTLEELDFRFAQSFERRFPGPSLETPRWEHYAPRETPEIAEPSGDFVPLESVRSFHGKPEAASRPCGG